MDVMKLTEMPVGTIGLDVENLAAQAKLGKGNSVDTVATNFESMFLSLLMKEMRQTLEPGGLFAQDNSDVYGGLFDLYLGQHLAQTGGMGVAKMVKAQLERQKINEDERAPATIR